jgi:hypothetical protein
MMYSQIFYQILFLIQKKNISEFFSLKFFNISENNIISSINNMVPRVDQE